MTQPDPNLYDLIDVPPRPTTDEEFAALPILDLQSWRCTKVLVDVDNDRTTRCWLPADHHGQDVTNNWDLHQDEHGVQW